MSVITSWVRESKWKPRPRRRKERPENRTSRKAVSSTLRISDSPMASVEQRLENNLALWRLMHLWQEQNVSANIPVVEAFEKGVKDFENDMNSCKPPLIRQLSQKILHLTNNATTSRLRHLPRPPRQLPLRHHPRPPQSPRQQK